MSTFPPHSPLSCRSLALMVAGAVALTRTEAGASKVVPSLSPPPQVPLRALDEGLREQGG